LVAGNAQLAVQLVVQLADQEVSTLQYTSAHFLPKACWVNSINLTFSFSFTRLASVRFVFGQLVQNMIQAEHTSHNQ
jgi:hypothetical protein